MLINGYDGSNIILAADALQTKALYAVLKSVTNVEIVQAAAMMQTDGHGFTAEDVRAIVDQFVFTLRKVAQDLIEKPNPDVVAALKSKEKKVLVN